MALGILLAVLTGLSWVVVGAVVGLAEKHGCGTSRFQLVGCVFSLTVSALAYAIGPALMPGSSAFRFLAEPRAAACMFVWGFFNFWMVLAMGCAMARGPNGPAWTITQSGFVFPFALGILSGNTPFSWLLAAGLALALANVVVTGLARDSGNAVADAEAPARKTAIGWFPLAVIAFVFCGANQCAALLVSYLPVEARPETLERFVWGSAGTLSGWCVRNAWVRIVNGPAPRDPDIRAKYLYLFKICAVNTTVSFTASLLFFFKSLDLLEEANAAAIANPIMVVSCFLGFAAYSAAILRERLTRTQWIAFVSGVAGIILLSVAAA